ncbi:hypothetical protein P7K49_021354, partial [Saguinus oedipus]
LRRALPTAEGQRAIQREASPPLAAEGFAAGLSAAGIPPPSLPFKSRLRRRCWRPVGATLGPCPVFTRPRLGHFPGPCPGGAPADLGARTPAPTRDGSEAGPLGCGLGDGDAPQLLR